METLAGSDRGRLVIDAWAGSVNVSAGREGAVEVALRCCGVLPAPALEIEREGGRHVLRRKTPPPRTLLPQNPSTVANPHNQSSGSRTVADSNLHWRLSSLRYGRWLRQIAKCDEPA